MHISHLAIIPDVVTSFLLENSDGPNREGKLEAFFLNYKEWCDSQGSCTSFKLVLVLAQINNSELLDLFMYIVYNKFV